MSCGLTHFECCNACQVRDPSLRGQPVGVTQKYLVGVDSQVSLLLILTSSNKMCKQLLCFGEQVVTANYPARASGVGKLMGTKDAVKACPALVLVREHVCMVSFTALCAALCREHAVSSWLLV